MGCVVTKDHYVIVYSKNSDGSYDVRVTDNNGRTANIARVYSKQELQDLIDRYS